MVVGPLGDKSMNMAFLSSFRIGQQTVYPEELRERLAAYDDFLDDRFLAPPLRPLVSQLQNEISPGAL